MALVTRSRCIDCRGRWLSLLLAWTLISGLPTGPLAAAALTEYEVKAGFLYHFGGFVEWPDTTDQGRAPTFTIGVLGAHPFGGVLDDIMRGKSIGAYPVVIQYYQRVEEAVSCHILFISASEEEWLPAILSGLGEASVLTVSDMQRFTERGGMISLRLVGQKVRFDINMDAAERAGLKLSSQLLRLARVIYGPRPLRE
jgi:YfiR/HmsC-like